MQKCRVADPGWDGEDPDPTVEKKKRTELSENLTNLDPDPTITILNF